MVLLGGRLWGVGDDLACQVEHDLARDVSGGIDRAVAGCEREPPCSAERFKGPGSQPVEYHEWRPTIDGVLLPAEVIVTWADEPGPWFKMRIERDHPGVDVSGAMARGRELLRQAAADPTGIGTRR